jgi:hypothetical protein
MAVYSVEGKLGTGKTKFCVWMAQRALRQGRRVASNVDLYLDELVPERRSASYQRIPDKPRAEDLEAIGHGNSESYDEDRNGVLILDELGSWLNSRTFGDKGRMPVIDWMIHARKKGWDVYLIVQDAGMIDKQVREALVEYSCRCVRLDKVKVPFFGAILGMFKPRLAYLPRMHIVTARVGYGASIIVAERWHFRGDDLHAAYDTRQVFVHDPEAVTRTVLHAGRFTAPVVRVSWWGRLAGVGRRLTPPVAPREPHPLVALIRRLPVEERMTHYRRLVERGAL